MMVMEFTLIAFFKANDSYRKISEEITLATDLLIFAGILILIITIFLTSLITGETEKISD